MPTVLVVIAIYRSKHPLMRNCDSSINLKYPWALAGTLSYTVYAATTCDMPGKFKLKVAVWKMFWSQNIFPVPWVHLSSIIE